MYYIIMMTPEFLINYQGGRDFMVDYRLELFSVPGQDDAQTGGADPGCDHKSSV